MQYKKQMNFHYIKFYYTTKYSTANTVIIIHTKLWRKYLKININ